MPNWLTVLHWLERADPPALAGTYVASRARRSDGDWPAASVVEQSVRFVYAPPGRWRMWLDEDVALVEPQLPPVPLHGLRYPGGSPRGFAPGPERLVLPAGSPALTSVEPLGEPRQILCRGRSAWVVELGAPWAGTISVTIDELLRIILDVSDEAVGYHEGLVDLQAYDQPTDDLFVSNEEDARASAAHSGRWDRLVDYYREHEVPYPNWWPDPVTPHVVDGDVDRRLVVVDLGIDAGSSGPTAALLVRQRPGDPPYRSGRVADPEVFVHRWSEGDWQWTLAVSGAPLSRADFARVRRGIHPGD